MCVYVNGRYVFRFNVNVLFGLILYIINYIKFIVNILNIFLLIIRINLLIYVIMVYFIIDRFIVGMMLFFLRNGWGF